MDLCRFKMGLGNMDLIIMLDKYPNKQEQSGEFRK